MVNAITVYDTSGDNYVGVTDNKELKVALTSIDLSGTPYSISFSGIVIEMSGAIINTNISGQSVTASISGQSVSASISGQPVTTTISGQAVTTNISGQSVGANISGQTVDVLLSGEFISIMASTVIRTGNVIVVTGVSGGLPCNSGVCNSLTIRNVGISGTVMFVGSSGDPPWVASGQSSYPFASGHGFWLRDGDGITLDTNNMANVKITSFISGQYASYIGVDT
jgi:hypothetical protein